MNAFTYFRRRKGANLGATLSRLAARAATLMVLSGLGAMPLHAQPKVVEYYNSLVGTQFPNEYDYPLVLKNGQWTSQNTSWETDMPVLVDGQNGYIFVNDEGTGGGNFTTEAVYWKRSYGPLLGIAETGYYPPYPEYSRLKFYAFENNAWIDETAYVWPKITLEDFMSDDMTIRDLRALKAIQAALYVKLPQKGLDAEVWLVIRNTEVNAVCNGEDWFKPSNTTPYLTYCNTLKHRLFNHMVVKWNKSDGVFAKGHLSRRVQPWK